MRRNVVRTLTAVLAILFLAVQGTWVLAGTTGNLNGSVTDENAKPVVGAKVTAASPSQTSTTTTDAQGRYNLLSLGPDTYTVSVSNPGYENVSQGGITVTADQTLTVNVSQTHRLTQIGRVTNRSSSDLVRPGTTSQVYTVNVATQQAVQGLGGGSNIDNAYSAINSTPGTYSAINNAGWGQTLYIHGASYSQVGFEYDGIPINRAFDNYNYNTLTNLGQQELQVFTGGAPPGSSSQTVGGYINQVIKTGTYPGSTTLQLGIAAPAFYNSGRLEIGGATPNRNFSYYVAGSGYGQNFRYLDPFNGTSITPDIRPYDVANNLLPAGFGVLGSCTNGRDPYTAQANAPGFIGTTNAAGYPSGGDPGCVNRFSEGTGALAATHDNEAVVNLHFGLPHKRSALRDDVQLLYSASALIDIYGDSPNDLGGYGNLRRLYGGLPNYPDGVTFPVGTRPLQPAPGLKPVPYYFPSSAVGRALNAPIPANQRGAVRVDTGIVKGQYQHAFNDKSYLRVYGYTDYSDWLQSDPMFIRAAFGGYGGLYNQIVAGFSEGDYELITHTRGASIDYLNQLNSKNLLTFTANYTTATTVRYNNRTYLNTNGSAATNLVSMNNGTFTCYDAAGNPTLCFSGASRGTFANPTPFAATGAAAAANAQWLVTKTGDAGTYNTVKPTFTSYALTDQYNATDKLLLNFGVRLEQYNYKLADLGTPIYSFWYQAAANSLCYDPTTNQPARTLLLPGQAPPAPPVVSLNCPILNGIQTLHPNGQNGALLYTNLGSGNIVRTAFEPRVSGTYTLDRNNVFRASFGKYAQPVQTAYVQYGAKDPSSLTSAGGAGGNFLDFFGLGYTTPKHDLPPAISYNTDAAFEHQFNNTDWSVSFAPFYRRTFNQYMDITLGPNFASAFPAANQNSFGYEIAIRKGDPSRQGWSGQLSYTFTKTGVQFINTPTGNNEIDTINGFINGFNALTGTGTLPDPRNPGLPKQTGAPCYLQGAAYGGCKVVNGSIVMDGNGIANGAVVNPYFLTPSQPLLNRNATYPGYQIPPYGNGAITDNATTIAPPSLFAGFISYKKNRLTVTPSFQLQSGVYYGNPLTVAGYDPRSCVANQGGGNPTGATDGNGAVLGVVPTAPNPGLANYLSCGAALVTGGTLAIPNPETAKFDGLGQFINPWVLNVNLQVGYDLSKRVHANMLLANVYNTCFGGSKGPWTVIGPSHTVCGYNVNGFYPANFYNGRSSADAAANGYTGVQQQFAHAYGPFVQNTNGFFPFNAYFQLQFKL